MYFSYFSDNHSCLRRGFRFQTKAGPEGKSLGSFGHSAESSYCDQFYLQTILWSISYGGTIDVPRIFNFKQEQFINYFCRNFSNMTEVMEYQCRV